MVPDPETATDGTRNDPFGEVDAPPLWRSPKASARRRWKATGRCESCGERHGRALAGGECSKCGCDSESGASPTRARSSAIGEDTRRAVFSNGSPAIADATLQAAGDLRDRPSPLPANGTLPTFRHGQPAHFTARRDRWQAVANAAGSKCRRHRVRSIRERVSIRGSRFAQLPLIPFTRAPGHPLGFEPGRRASRGHGHPQLPLMGEELGARLWTYWGISPQVCRFAGSIRGGCKQKTSLEDIYDYESTWRVGIDEAFNLVGQFDAPIERSADAIGVRHHNGISVPCRRQRGAVEDLGLPKFGAREVRELARSCFKLRNLSRSRSGSGLPPRGYPENQVADRFWNSLDHRLHGDGFAGPPPGSSARRGNPPATEPSERDKEGIWMSAKQGEA